MAVGRRAGAVVRAGLAGRRERRGVQPVVGRAARVPRRVEADVDVRGQHAEVVPPAPE